MKTQTIKLNLVQFKKAFATGILLITVLCAPAMYAQETPRTVEGIVKTLDGPLPGATIILKGTTTGVISNEDGTFVFPKKLKENDVLLVTYLGYHDAEITIGRKTNYIEPFLKDNGVVIFGALRVGDTTKEDGL